MSSYAYLEVDNGEFLSIEENGINVGKPLTAFFSIYHAVVTGRKKSSELIWFRRLDEQSDVNLRILTKVFYGEDLIYLPEGYERFLAEWGKIVGDISEVEFRQRLSDLEKMWTPIDEFLPVIEEMVRLLPRMGEDTLWYTAVDTQPAFHGLLNTLKQAQRNGGKKIRILIR